MSSGYVGPGGQWVEYTATPAASPSGSGLTAAELASVQATYRGEAFPVNEVSPLDWIGFDLTGTHDNTTILQAAIDEAAFKFRSNYGFGVSNRLMLPPGRIVFSGQLLIRQNSWIEGNYGAAGATELRWAGPNNVDAISNVSGIELSFCHLSNLRLQDIRTDPTGGVGISFKDFNNGVSLRRIQVMQFPQVHIYVGSDPGQASDCVEIYDAWVTSSKPNAKGILIERCDNQVIINYIKSDITTSPANDGYVIRCENMANDNVVVEIANVKHEGNNRCPTLSFPANTKGNLAIRNIVQRSIAGGAGGAGDIVQFGAAAASSAFHFDNTSSGRTTGAASEGGRVTLENIAGNHHGDWTGASGAATIRCVGTGALVYGPVARAMAGVTGRIVRDLAGNNSPAGAVYGNVGDRYSRLDATSITCGTWVKQFGAATTTGWTPLTPETQSPAYAGTLAVNLQSGNRVVVGTLTGNITHSAPTNVPAQGVQVVYEFTQDGTGGRTIAWSSAHKGAWPTGSGTANQKKTVSGRSDGTNLLFVGDSGWYT